MAVDIVPELLNDILDHFEEAWHDNGKLPGLVEKLKNGTATYAEANEYASEVGRMMKEAYMANLSSDRLPDGKCYYNIADRIIRETEHMQYVRVSDYAMKVQSDLNKKAGIGLKAIAPEEDTGLVQSLINKAANADQYDDVSAYVSQTMESMARKTVDHSVKANADFQYKAGMRPRIIRSGGSKCCEWCSGLTGKYDYPDVPKDVYARHNNCSCTVEYVPGDGKRQDVWSKNWISEEEAQRREELKTLGLDDSDKHAKIEYRKNIKSVAEVNAEKRIHYKEMSEISATAGTLPDKMKKYVPKTEDRMKIIEDGIQREKPIFCKKDELLYNLAELLPEEKGFYTVVLHGDKYYCEYNGQVVDADTICAIIAQRKDYKKGTDIRLISCYSGSEDDGVARYISEKLKVNVLAPDKKGIITKTLSGKVYAYSGSADGVHDGEMRLFKYREK